ncbi:hypothetical protein [Nocardiopsis salina]|uniref:hypothetical protein n=1 Tax=Nocardiopsis salina TaxID=245836 RepID=UPI001269709E|nr:hypothetical protein [Nocardiopsis salina]
MLEAQVGVPRAKEDHGLDACTPQQQALRALLAVAVFNSDYLGAPPRDWGAHILNVYAFHLSPRFDDLHIVTDVPENVANRLILSGFEHEYRIPGMRAVCYGPDHTRFWHVPTGATFLVRSRGRAGMRLRCGLPCSGSWQAKDVPMLEHPMSSVERSEWGAVPPMSTSSLRLLSGLFTRMALRSPDRSWATAGWHFPPHDVPDAFPYQAGAGKMLWGSGDHWTLRWKGFPNPEFVATALTDPTIGMKSAEVKSVGEDLVVFYGSAQLRLVEENRSVLGSSEEVLKVLRSRKNPSLRGSRKRGLQAEP